MLTKNKTNKFIKKRIATPKANSPGSVTSISHQNNSRIRTIPVSVHPDNGRAYVIEAVSLADLLP
jgi:alpha-D-ribose 1-methylphosphonate 5-triphosphate diphosphatase PhnM